MIKRSILLVALGVLFVFMACAGRITSLKEPTSDDSFVVIGSVIFQNDYFVGDEVEVYKDGIDVAIVGEVEEDGKKKISGYWATTDKNGYFVLSDVPPGKYALQAIRLTVGVQRLITISSNLRYSGSEYTIQMRENVIFEAEYFGVEPKGRVVNLKHHVFGADHSTAVNRQILHHESAKIENAKLIDGSILKRGPVEEYFIKTYPKSAWVPVLKAALD
ncbi:hypothetical protein JXJ21_13430 [candidate division KSB1 bacterium]|nr:hypothetical protein [candidate division KSB1 bacterium]